MKSHVDTYPDQASQFMKESTLCKSLSGLEVPILTISSRVQSRTFEVIDENEFTSETLPLNKYKKYIIVCSRVHPGETIASYIMQGFLNFISSNEPFAIELRKRIVFKVIPMTNPDGVIVGNYRTSMSGNDLNR
jgi:murein tripeptide amidase MpaA